LISLPLSIKVRAAAGIMTRWQFSVGSRQFEPPTEEKDQSRLRSTSGRHSVINSLGLRHRRRLNPDREVRRDGTLQLAVGSRQFEPPTEVEDQSRIRQLADQDGTRQSAAVRN